MRPSQSTTPRLNPFISQNHTLSFYCTWARYCTKGWREAAAVSTTPYACCHHSLRPYCAQQYHKMLKFKFHSKESQQSFHSSLYSKKTTATPFCVLHARHCADTSYKWRNGGLGQLNGPMVLAELEFNLTPLPTVLTTCGLCQRSVI